MAGFADKLAAVMDERDMGVRTLARAMSPGLPGNVEQERRTLRRYLNGDVVPRPARRRLIERVLGLAEGALEPDDEEAELAAELHSLAVAAVRPERYETFAALRFVAGVGDPEVARERAVELAAAHAVCLFFQKAGQSRLPVAA